MDWNELSFREKYDFIQELAVTKNLRTLERKEQEKEITIMGAKEELLAHFGTDSQRYDILQDAANSITKVPGLSMEIGIRTGGSSKFMIEEYFKGGYPRTHVAIDPYGSIPYLYQENNTIEGSYRNDDRDLTIPGLFLLCRGTIVNFIYYQLEDFEFFKRFSDGVPVYLANKKTVENKYAIVYFDGPHTLETTMAETVFFEKRASPGAHFVYDDTDIEYYDHSKIKEFLISKGWKPKTETHHKTSYFKPIT
jgi:hypothetical protein